ncbi:MAG: PIN domain-containing protein [Actinomycetota bacterium]|nr:PIN domain-containing protein [Actinomycetota bacterium]
MGPKRPRAVVLDAGALVAFERNDQRVRRLIELATEHGGSLHVPAGVIAQVWRDGARQARLSRLVKSGVLDVQNLDSDEARAVGSLCALTGTADVVDASVALLARRHRAVVVTSDPDDVRRLDAGLAVVRC